MKLTSDEFIESLDNGVILPYEQELIDNVRNYTYLSMPVSVSLLSFPLCNGNCYAMSVLLTMGMGHFKLVHGNVNTYPLDDEYPNHSWVEKDGYVYDPTFGCKFEKNFYYEHCEVEVVEIYDEHNIQNYDLYNEIIIKINQEEVTSERLSIMLQYLEMLEIEDNTINHHMLLDEISECREVYGATTVYDDRVMQKYKSYMNDNLK